MENKSYFEHALKWGLIMGFANILIFLLVYLINKELLVSFTLMGVVFLLNMVILVLAVRSRRQDLGGFISFQEAFLVALITAMAAVLIGSIYNYILYNFIDAGLADYIKEKVILKAQTMMQKMGAPDEEIEKAIEKMQAEDMRMTPGKLLMQIVWSAILYAIPALIIAAIMKKKSDTVNFES